jgi:lactoylglutathione lyase
MIPIHDLFETHLAVTDLRRSIAFYGDAVGLELAQFFPERRVAFFWIGGRGKSMLGLWEVGTVPLRQSLHLAFRVSLQDLLQAPEVLRQAGIAPLDFDGNATEEPVVLAWMPAGSLYFHDPDGNLLEFLAMLEDDPNPNVGVVNWSQWVGLRGSSEAKTGGMSS